MGQANEAVLVTQSGLEKLQAELEELVNVRRPQNTQRIRDAKALGDLSENFDFHDAKREQAFIEGRIQALKETLGRAQVVSNSEGADGRVRIGSTVELVNAESGARSVYTIVGAVEANPAQGKISNASPVGQALMGQAEGATVEIRTPRGVQVYRVDAVR